MSDLGWQWDPSLYSGSAQYYVRGRVPYPRELADRLATEAELDGTGRLLDVGCGPGSLTLLLAALFESATGVDADAGMIAEARRQAGAAGITNVDWLVMRAEDLPAGLGRYRMITLAQSFHWMDRARVARTLHGMLAPGGVCVHVHATTHQGVDIDAASEYPRPPRAAVDQLIERYLGTTRRAGQSVRPPGVVSDEDDVYRAAGFTDRRRIELPGRWIVRDVDDIVASTFSLSSSAPHLFGDRRDAFEHDLRQLLTGAARQGRFSERMREISVDIWKPR